MIAGICKARQPTREVWSRERLVHERAIALGNALDRSTLSNYSSALNSYLNFVKLHDLPVEPTATVRKRALTVDDLQLVVNRYNDTSTHDDLLFISMLLTGFFGLLRLGELVFPDEAALQNWKKVTRRHTVHIQEDFYEFLLPGHKADRFFEGNKIMIPALRFNLSPLRHFTQYLDSRDTIHPVASPLWLTQAGTVPTRSFFITRLHLFFKRDVAGHSMRAGGATSLAEQGMSPAIIQASGRWVSDTFLVYIWKNPTLLQGFLHTVSTPSSVPV